MAESMTKRVNINAQVAIRNINPPIYGTCNDIVMTTGDILKCICKRARVEEILPDGSAVRLNLTNYYKDNGAGLSADKAMNKSIGTSEKPARFKVPVAPFDQEKAQVVETKTEEPNEIVLDHDETSDAITHTITVDQDSVFIDGIISDAENPVATTTITINRNESRNTHTSGSKKNKKHHKH